jgi:DNA primase
VGGDVFAFIKRIENVSFGEALLFLDPGSSATRLVASTPTPVTTQSILRAFAEQSGQLELTEEHNCPGGRCQGFTLLTAATEVYHAALLQQPKLLMYLAGRGFGLDAVRKYRFGYAAGDNLEKYFRFRGWNVVAGLDLGLLIKKEDGAVREYFNKRIVIPEWCVCSGGPARAIYLVGRATEGWQKAKYLGLPNAPKPLWGAERARDACEVFVCEGVFDMLTLVEWGYAAVATLGHPKHEHVEELAGVQRIYIATDADAVGREFAATLKERFGDRALVLPSFKRFKNLQDIKDVNELMEKHPLDGRDIFARLVRYAETHQE